MISFFGLITVRKARLDIPGASDKASYVQKLTETLYGHNVSGGPRALVVSSIIGQTPSRSRMRIAYQGEPTLLVSF